METTGPPPISLPLRLVEHPDPLARRLLRHDGDRRRHHGLLHRPAHQAVAQGPARDRVRPAVGSGSLRTLKYAVAQIRILRQRYPAAMHLAIFWGMVLLFIGTVLARSTPTSSS